MTKVLIVNNCQLGSLAIENKKPSPKGLEITSLYIQGKISSEDAIRKIKEVYGC